MSRDKGIALPLVLFVLLILFPLTMHFMHKSSGLARVLRHEKMGSAARRLGDNMVEDYLSAFSKGTGYYENHFTPAVLERTRTYFESGYSSVTVQGSPVARTVVIRARGDYGQDPNAPRKTRTLEAMFRFVPLIGAQLMSAPGGFDFGIPNMTVQGPVRADGDLIVSAANVTFNQPVVAGRAVSALGSSRFLSQVYYGTTLAPAYNAVVYPAGVPIHDVPPGASFSIDRSFYQINSTTFSIGTSVWWEFRDNFGTGEYRSRWDANADHAFTVADPPAGPWTAIPLGRGIFYVDQAKTYVSGTVRGRITIVCTSPNTDPVTEINRGVIEVIGPRFGYTAGDLATANQSIFALSSRGYIFSQTANGPVDLTVDGAFYAEAPSFTTPCGPWYGVWVRRTAGAANANDKFVVNGSWNRMGLCEDLPVSNLAPVFNFDPNLQIFPSPGVPEKAVLVSWRRIGS